MNDDGPVREVSTRPHLTRQLARAVVTGPLRRGADLPTTHLLRSGVVPDHAHVAAYARVCGATLGDRLPPTYLHLAAFELSVALMADRRFPFPLVGLVHVANEIGHHRPVHLDEPIDLRVHLADLRPHPKGRQFDVRAAATVDGDLVWSSTSTYLRRGGGQDAGHPPTPVDAVDVTALPLTALWQVPADTGRRYGRVSGDRNPIHLSAVTARAFGFRRAIAHGMWTKARAIAGLAGRLPEAFSVAVVFKRPMLLPATVEYATTASADTFGVRGRSGEPHLAGVVRPL